jgi:hypothetical protein
MAAIFHIQGYRLNRTIETANSGGFFIRQLTFVQQAMRKS